MQPYKRTTEQQMKKFYNTLSEKDKRRYAAVEALKLGHGGTVYISKILSCTRKTVSQGIQELEELPEESDYEKRIREPGGGRKPYDKSFEDIDKKFLDILKDYTAGDPMNEKVVWTNLTQQETADRLNQNYGIQPSRTVIRQLLKKYNYRKRKAQKKRAIKDIDNRNDQFENIAKFKSEYTAAEQPVISIDTKKKEFLGNFYRDGYLYTQKVIETYDHDFNSFSSGIVIPHGIYDLKENKGYINIGISKDTSEFVCDSIRNWWYHQGQYDYPEATSILMLSDSGGSNNCHHYIFKEDLQKLVNEIGLEIRVAHYPPYTSKYNPIEHRLFPHITRACQGVIFKTVETVKELIEKTKTKTGLRVTVEIINKIYHAGRKVAEDFKENMKIVFDNYLPQWNYRVVPIPVVNG